MTHLSIKKYRQTSKTNLSDANPHQAVSEIFKHIIGNLAAAKGAVLQKDIEKKGKLISEAMTLIAVLSGSLDFKEGGEISDNLYALYDYCNRQLLQANLKNDTDIIDEVVQLLLPIKSSWDTIPQEEQNKVSFS